MKNKFQYALCFISLLTIGYSQHAYSQNADIELLTNKADACIKDSFDQCKKYAFVAFDVAKKKNLKPEQAKALSIIAKVYRIKNDNKKAEQFYLQALELRIQTGDKKYIAQTLTNLGLVNTGLSNFKSALGYFNSSLKLKEELKDTSGKAIVLTNIANVYFKMGEYEKALLFYQQALTVFVSLKNSEGQASCMNGCGLVSENMGNTDKAIEYYNAALAISNKLNNKYLLADIFNNLGNVFSKMKNYPQAVSNYKKSLDLRRQLNDRQGIASSLNNIGLNYKLNNNFSASVEYLNQALTINQAIDNKFEQVLNLNALAENYYELKTFPQSFNYANQSLTLARQLNNKPLVQLNYSLLSRLYKKTGRFQLALEYREKAITLQDSLENMEVKKKINELQTRYDTRRKEQDMELLAKQNEVQQLQLSKSRFYLFGMTAVLLILIFAGFLLFRQYRLKRKHESLVLEQKLLRTQMNPHFIFNALASIQSFIFDENKLRAGKYISDLSSLMRSVLENSREELISLEQEISTLKNYLELHKLRYENKFDYTIEVDPRLISEMIELPPMLGQPFVENSIKHGFLKSDVKGLIQIRFSIQEQRFFFEIEDNGIGRKKAAELQQNNNHVSQALAITTERVENFNKHNRKKIRFQIIDLTENDIATGTLVKFEIPLYLVANRKKN